jgi:hypothetical protein
MLMQHYERTGEFAKRNELLHADAGRTTLSSPSLHRSINLLGQSDATLQAANLPRAEVLGFEELQARQHHLAASGRDNTPPDPDPVRQAAWLLRFCLT